MKHKHKARGNIYCEACKRYHKEGKHTDRTVSAKENVDAVIGLMTNIFRLKAG